MQILSLLTIQAILGGDPARRVVGEGSDDTPVEGWGDAWAWLWT